MLRNRHKGSTAPATTAGVRLGNDAIDNMGIDRRVTACYNSDIRAGKALGIGKGDPMNTINLKEVEGLSVEDMLEQLEAQVKRELKQRPERRPHLCKLLAQASNYIASQVA